MSDAAQSAPAPDSERRLAEVIADHFVGARVVEADGAWVVELGEDLPVIECRIDTQQDHPPYGVFVFLSIRGGALGGAGALVTASGYGPSPEHALTLAGCNWACAFGPVLLTGIGRPELINTEDPDVELFETTLDGRRHLFAVGHLDRWSDSARAAGAERRRLGGSSALTRAVLTSGTIPSTRSDGVIALGCFLACGRATSTEVKLGTADWPAAAEVLERLAPPPDESAGLHMLREWAILAPLEPAPELTREGLQRTLDLLRACGADPDAEAGWHGARRHGMRLGEPGPADPSLPAEANRFLTRIAASGAGPGYGLEPRRIDERWWHLADAGCGARWLLDLTDGAVWLDSRACDDGFAQVAPGLTAWYEAWLDNAIHGGGPFARWEHRADAAYKMLARAARENGVDALPRTVTRVRIHSPEGEPLGPCHACERTYARFGVPPEVFTTAPAQGAPDGPAAPDS